MKTPLNHQHSRPSTLKGFLRPLGNSSSTLPTLQVTIDLLPITVNEFAL